MNVFYILTVFAVFFFALIWHDDSARTEKTRENPARKNCLPAREVALKANIRHTGI